jgi:flagellin
MVINTNIPALRSATNLDESSTALAKSLQKLSSGSRIISPEDDAAGAGVSLRFDAQIARIGAAKSNLSNAISFAQTQDGFLQKVGKALDRMSELSTLAQDVTKTNTDRSLYDQEFQKLGTYVNDLATKDFNGVSLFNATTLGVTTDSDANTVAMTALNFTNSGTSYQTAASSNVADATSAYTALTNVKAAIISLTSDRANVGANIAVLSSYNDQLSVLSNNLSQANSRIRDVDVAQESTNYARFNILVQSGTAMLAQANQSTQGVLKLLQ